MCSSQAWFDRARVIDILGTRSSQSLEAVGPASLKKLHTPSKLPVSAYYYPAFRVPNFVVVGSCAQDLATPKKGVWHEATGTGSKLGSGL